MLMGIDQIGSIREKFIEGKRVGLITNNSARNREGKSSLEIVKKVGGYKSLTLLTPEHGYFGDYQSGETVESYYDSALGVQVESLYRKPDSKKSSGSNDIDREMRETDSIKDSSKLISREIIDQFDTLIFDLQDVGCRIYTYIATMVYAMEITGGTDIDFIVLDRPNPLSGNNPDGPLLLDNLQSFIGAMPVPVKHSLTVGEIATFFNRNMAKETVRLNVVKMKEWKRDMWYDQLGIPWTMPSPNMPTLNTATVYPGCVLIEGTNISEGRGTTKPFEIIGAPWLDAGKLISDLEKHNPAGVMLNEIRFKPYFSKYTGEKCNGLMINVINRNIFRPFEFVVHLISSIYGLHPDKIEFHDHYFDSVAGNREIRNGTISGANPVDIIENYQEDLRRYREKIKEIMLY